MRAVTVTYMYWGSPQIQVFSYQYKGLPDERMIRKVKYWAQINFRKDYEAGEVAVTFYSDIMDITTAVAVPL